VAVSAPGAPFTAGIYDVSIEQIPVARSLGFDMVQVYDSRQDLTSAMRYLAAAQAVALGVIQNMPSSHLEDDPEFWKKWVTTLAAFDNIVWWYLPEEPRPDNRAAMQELYDLVHEIDPKQRPVAVYFGTTHLEDWCDVADIILVPAYPDYHRAPRADVLAWMDNARAMCPGKQVISVQALFDADFNGDGDRPSAVEARSDAYAALIHGSSTLMWYSFSRGEQLPELWSASQEIIQEMKTLSPVIEAPAPLQTIPVEVVTGPAETVPVLGYTYASIQTMERVYEGDRYIFAVNLTNGSVLARFQNLPQGSDEVSVLFEDRTVPVRNGLFSDKFEPSAVHIYKIPLP
jgi:hypothetical protein